MQNHHLNTSKIVLDGVFFFKCDDNDKKIAKRKFNKKNLQTNKKYATLKIIECPLRRFSENQ